MKIQFNTDKTISGDENQEIYILDRRKAKPIPIAYYPNRSAFIRRKWKKRSITIHVLNRIEGKIQ
jgi:hypothetical protein